MLTTDFAINRQDPHSVWESPGLAAELMYTDLYREPGQSHITAYKKSKLRRANLRRRINAEIATLQQAYGFATPQFRANAPLPLHAEELVDREVQQQRTERLAFVQALLDAGLTVPMPEWLAVINYIWQEAGLSGQTRRTMNPEGRGQDSAQDITTGNLPIYCTVGDFKLDIRTLMAGQRSGYDLDVSQVGQLTRRMNEDFEEAHINGAIDANGSLVDFGGGRKARGLLTAPGAQNYQYAAAAAGTNPRNWDNPSKTGYEIVDGDILNMVAKAIAMKAYGPYGLVLNTTYANTLNRRYDVSYGDQTILQHIRTLEFGGKPITIITADRMPADRVALFQMTKDVVAAVVGQPPTAIMWPSGSGMSFSTLLVGCMVPLFRTDYAGNGGVVLGDVNAH